MPRRPWQDPVSAPRELPGKGCTEDGSPPSWAGPGALRCIWGVASGRSFADEGLRGWILRVPTGRSLLVTGFEAPPSAGTALLVQGPWTPHPRFGWGVVWNARVRRWRAAPLADLQPFTPDANHLEEHGGWRKLLASDKGFRWLVAGARERPSRRGARTGAGRGSLALRGPCISGPGPTRAEPPSTSISGGNGCAVAPAPSIWGRGPRLSPFIGWVISRDGRRPWSLFGRARRPRLALGGGGTMDRGDPGRRCRHGGRGGAGPPRPAGVVPRSALIVSLRRGRPSVRKGDSPCKPFRAPFVGHRCSSPWSIRASRWSTRI